MPARNGAAPFSDRKLLGHQFIIVLVVSGSNRRLSTSTTCFLVSCISFSAYQHQAFHLLWRGSTIVRDMTAPATLCNSLITSKQLLALRNEFPDEAYVDSTIYKISLLTQTAGVLLRLPQEVIATSIVVLQRYLVLVHDLLGSNYGQSTRFAVDSVLIQASSASAFLAAKQSFYSLSPRSIINVYALLTSTSSSPLHFINPAVSTSQPDAKTYYVSEGQYQSRREALFVTEKSILVTSSFNTTFASPYTLALTYLSALSSSQLSERVLAHLNAALLSPQLLYLTHQPNALAVSAIYLAAREVGVSLVDEDVQWWEVFDVGREELGFLVLSLGSTVNFVRARKGTEPADD